MTCFRSFSQHTGHIIPMETAVAKVLSDILLALDEGDLACLALLDLSVTFETVDHEVLLQRLHITYGVNGVAHNWFRL